MSGKSVTLTFGEPEAPARQERTANPAAFTREERSSAGWHVRLIGWIIGLPSILSIAFVGGVGLWYAYATTADAKTWIALSAGIVIVTLFTAGLPIGAALNRETEPGIAKAAFGFWAACIALNLAIMGHFAWNQAAPAIPAPAIVHAIPMDDDGETDIRIEELRGAIEEARVRTPADARRLANIKSELGSLETRRYGGPISPASPIAPIQAPGLDLAAVALLTLIGAALGLLISASSLAAILTEKAATVRVEAPATSSPGPMPMPSFPAPDAPDAFEAWADDAISRGDGLIKSADAQERFALWVSRNDYGKAMDPRAFGVKLSAYLKAAYGVTGRHSGGQGGTVYDGVTLSADPGYTNGAAARP